jgi:hypothetical protein
LRVVSVAAESWLICSRCCGASDNNAKTSEIRERDPGVGFQLVIQRSQQQPSVVEIFARHPLLGPAHAVQFSQRSTGLAAKISCT